MEEWVAIQSERLLKPTGLFAVYLMRYIYETLAIPDPIYTLRYLFEPYQLGYHLLQNRPYFLVKRSKSKWTLELMEHFSRRERDSV
ncbi:hypothetical protein [Sporosarcina sp. NPDC096371]|uniref:hypothetical protein n=1 Tax=Sporosarcina sp. NPDC096371 TaxID=3364530 RepID=UPI00380F2622